MYPIQGIDAASHAPDHLARVDGTALGGGSLPRPSPPSTPTCPEWRWDASTAGVALTMPDFPNVPQIGPAAVHTASGLRSCEVCGAEIQGGRTITCSDRCRAERWRRGQEQARRGRDAPDPAPSARSDPAGRGADEMRDSFLLTLLDGALTPPLADARRRIGHPLVSRSDLRPARGECA